MARRSFNESQRKAISQDYLLGSSRADLCATYGVDPDLLDEWIQCGVITDPFWLQGPKHFAMPDGKVREIINGVRNTNERLLERIVDLQDGLSPNRLRTDVQLACAAARCQSKVLQRTLAFQLQLPKEDNTPVEELIRRVRSGEPVAIESPDWEEYKAEHYQRDQHKTKVPTDTLLNHTTHQAFVQEVRAQEEALCQKDPDSLVSLELRPGPVPETDSFPTENGVSVPPEEVCLDPSTTTQDLIDTHGLSNFNRTGPSLLVMCPICRGLECVIIDSYTSMPPTKTAETTVDIRFQCIPCSTQFRIDLTSDVDFRGTTVTYRKLSWVPL